MNLKKLNTYYHTLVHVKLIQLYYQLYYRLFGRFLKPKLETAARVSNFLTLKEGLLYQDSFTEPHTFNFLNLEKQFDKIDWNFNTYGKLWTYNLNYFDYLHQESISKERGLQLINNFCDQKDSHCDGYEPYPISLRGINWVKFLSLHTINDSRINQQLFDDYNRLSKTLEYHLLANHLLENAFSLLFGAYYFQEDTWYAKAQRLLKQQLEEQILPDGAHYELSPMYHSIILHRVLDSYNLVSNAAWKDKALAPLLKKKASLMLGWLQTMQFEGGALPMVNDTTIHITPSPEAIYAYAKRLAISSVPQPLKESGYRKLKTPPLEVLFDVGQIAPAYQPGHAHADSLQILVYNQGTPLIVDTGISTYEKNERRQLERSTCSHNTITVNHLNSSQVWSGFRVAKRAKTTILEDFKDRVLAVHNGYRSLGIAHKREVRVLDQTIQVSDTLTGGKKEDVVQGHLHLHPEVTYEIKDTVIILNNSIEIRFPKETVLDTQDYLYSQGFNNLVSAQKIKYTFKHQNTFTISPL
ncbi:heparinase II/III family protein [Mariniflexile ostreae]|uniref:Heparinase II/III family protein n=1 Tax=Mariniflexile ostreae TaxID=1520892 RepID=A0ABV5FCE8_9FLAO